jgi:hypothetical protein
MEDATIVTRESEQAIGHVVSTKPAPAAPTTPSDIDLTRYDGVDIVKHPERARRKKAIFILPACLSVNGVGGKLGTIANMNTGFPVLYIDFPIGRMKLQGRLVEPKSALMPMTFKKKSRKVIVKNAVKTMIVFSNTSWIGTKEENPEEKPLPMPEGMQV